MRRRQIDEHSIRFSILIAIPQISQRNLLSEKRFVTTVASGLLLVLGGKLCFCREHFILHQLIEHGFRGNLIPQAVGVDMINP